MNGSTTSRDLDTVLEELAEVRRLLSEVDADDFAERARLRARRQELQAEANSLRNGAEGEDE